MTIELVPYDKDHLIPKNGKYLIKTISNSHLKTQHFLEVRCEIVNGKTSIDVTNQTVTHISTQPIH